MYIQKGTRPLLAPDVDLEVIGKCNECEGYTGADLAALVRESGIEAMKQFMLIGCTGQLMVTNENFQRAILKIRPSVTEKVNMHSSLNGESCAKHEKNMNQF